MKDRMIIQVSSYGNSYEVNVSDDINAPDLVDQLAALMVQIGYAPTSIQSAMNEFDFSCEDEDDE